MASPCIFRCRCSTVEVKGFEWLIPGLRHELLVALIKSMPKPMRKNFVPAPNYADALLATLNPEQGPLLDEMERQLRRMTGSQCPGKPGIGHRCPIT